VSSISQKEAIYIFNENEVCQGYWLSEFESLVREREALGDFKDQKIKAAYVVIGAQDFAQAMVLFQLPVTNKGFVDSGWYLPLRRLADGAGHGPNMGDGRIRLACQSQCSISWHAEAMWEPVTSDFMAIRKAIRDNLIGKKPLSMSEANNETMDQSIGMSSISLGGAGVASAMSKRHSDPEVEQLKNALKTETLAYRNQLQQLQREIERQKVMADKAQRLLGDEQLAQELSELKQVHLHEMQSHQQEMDELKQALAQQQEANDALRQSQPLQIKRTEDIDALQQQLSQLQEVALRAEEHSVEHFIDRLNALEAVLVCFHSGAGHLTIAAEHMESYAENPTAFAAQKCQVDEALYSAWLDHYDDPKCQQCREEIPRVEHPQDYSVQLQGFCNLHRQMKSMAAS
jgi:hypothetical protein